MRPRGLLLATHPARAVAIVTLIIACQLAGAGRAGADDYDIGQGPLEAIKSAAEHTLDGGADCGLTKRKLTAMMLSIPMWELLGGRRDRAPSPMTLSRWDGWSRTANRPLYSFGTLEGRPRAHWNPGVGLWQLDTWNRTEHLSSWRRVKPHHGGRPVADYLRDAACSNSDTVRDAMYRNWYACRPDTCWTTFNELYVAASDSLQVEVRAGLDSWAGGATAELCRLGDDGAEFACGYLNIDDLEGYADTTVLDGEGATGRTPLAKPFMSFSRDARKYAVWLRNSTGWEEEIVRWAADDANARDSGDWDHGSRLQVRRCSYPACIWDPGGLYP